MELLMWLWDTVDIWRDLLEDCWVLQAVAGILVCYTECYRQWQVYKSVNLSLTDSGRYISPLSLTGSGRCIILPLTLSFMGSIGYITQSVILSLTGNGRYIAQCLTGSGRYIAQYLTDSGRYIAQCLTDSGRYIAQCLAGSGRYISQCLTGHIKYISQSLASSLTGSGRSWVFISTGFKPLAFGMRD